VSRFNPENPVVPPEGEAPKPDKDHATPLEEQNEAGEEPKIEPDEQGEGEEGGEEHQEGAREAEERKGEEGEEDHQGLSVRERLIPKMARLRDSTRALVLVGLAGMAAYLTSVLLAIPVTRLIEPWVAGDPRLTVFRSVIYGAFVLDLPKVLAGVLYSFAFGRFMEIRAWASAVGILLTIYVSDLGLSYVIGSFTLTWGNRHALMGRLPLAMLGFALVVLMALWANRRKQRSSAHAEGADAEKQESESLEGVSPKPPETLKGVNGGPRD
jgi:hypothetical protein